MQVGIILTAMVLFGKDTECKNQNNIGAAALMQKLVHLGWVHKATAMWVPEMWYCRKWQSPSARRMSPRFSVS